MIYDLDKTIDSSYVSVPGGKMHYLSTGQGDPILFLHGMPTSSYLWRKVMPVMADSAHCIAPDLIGMGQSSKLDISYTVFDHIQYIESFVDALDLRDITLVLHGWGSVIGFEFARRHPDKVKAIAFFEAHVRPTTDWSMLSLPVQELSHALSNQHLEQKDLVLQDNFLVNKLLPSASSCPIPEQTLEVYRHAFPDSDSRQPLWQYIQESPLCDGCSPEVLALITDYSQWLTESSLPKLMLYGVPGFITTMDSVLWARDNIKNIELIEVEDALHFAQETMPGYFSELLKKWYHSLS